MFISYFTLLQRSIYYPPAVALLHQVLETLQPPLDAGPPPPAAATALSHSRAFDAGLSPPVSSMVITKGGHDPVDEAFAPPAPHQPAPSAPHQVTALYSFAAERPTDLSLLVSFSISQSEAILQSATVKEMSDALLGGGGNENKFNMSYIFVRTFGARLLVYSAPR